MEMVLFFCLFFVCLFVYLFICCCFDYGGYWSFIAPFLVTFALVSKPECVPSLI